MPFAHWSILYNKLQFINDCGDLSIVLCARSFLYILESIISTCAIFGGLRCNYYYH